MLPRGGAKLGYLVLRLAGSVFAGVFFLLLFGLGDLVYQIWHVNVNYLRSGAIIYLLGWMIKENFEWHKPSALTPILIIVLTVWEVFHLLKERERVEYGRTVMARIVSVEPTNISINGERVYIISCSSGDGLDFSVKTTRTFPADIVGKSVKVCVAIGNGDNYEIDFNSIGQDESQETAPQP